MNVVPTERVKGYQSPLTLDLLSKAAVSHRTQVLEPKSSLWKNNKSLTREPLISGETFVLI